MKKFFKSIALAGIFILCTTLQAITDTQAWDILDKIGNPDQTIHAEDIIGITDYLHQHYYSYVEIDNNLLCYDAHITQYFSSLLSSTYITQKLIQAIVAESPKIDPDTLNNLLSLFPQLIDPLTNASTSQLAAMNDSLIQVLITRNYTQDGLNKITSYVSNHITTTECQTVQAMVNCSTQAIIPLLKAAFEQPATPISLIDFLFNRAVQCHVTIPAQYSKAGIKKRILEFFKKSGVKADIRTLTMIVIYKHMFGSLPTTALPYITPTLRHAIENANILAASSTFTTCTTQQRCSILIDTILSKEQELDSKGYYTFIHAQRWQFRIVEQWFTKLWEVRNKRTVSDFIFAHCEKPCKTKADQAKEMTLRKDILAHCTGEYHREKLLFLNYAFFGNENLSSSSSAHYLLNNFSAIDIKISLQDIFSMLDYQKYYNAYRQELEALEEEHKKLSTNGHLLLVAVPKTKIEDCVYISGSGGVQKWTYIDGNMTKDVELTMDTLRNCPEKISDSNIIQFCLILTGDILTPDSGIKVYSYGLADPEQLAAFDKKSDELFARIKNDILKH
jgi:hypothetical protein